MADFARNTNPGPGAGLGWLALGAVSLAAMGLLGNVWYAGAARPTRGSDLQMAVAAFDHGHLAPATAAFRQLAGHGNAEAAYWYGHALERGLGTAIDVKAAVQQYEKAWAGGVTKAATQLGELYLNGNRVAPDFAKARAYLTAAADRGDARAALDLGRMLRQGIGGPADPVGAYAWLEIAALRGSAEARIERNRLLPTLSPAQQTAASRQAQALELATAAPRHHPADPPHVTA